MALSPCSICNRLYRGAAQHAYPALVGPVESYGSKLRLCPADFDLVIGKFEDHEMEAQDGLFDDGRLPPCVACEMPVDPDEAWQFFATTYARADERRDWWAPVHSRCVQNCRSAFAMVLRPAR